MRVGTDVVVSIRRLLPSDRDPLHRILLATGVFSPEEIQVALELIDSVLQEPNDDDYIIHTAVEEDSLVVGYYCLGPTPLTDSTFDLYWIAVSPDSQKRRIGKTLLEHAERTAFSMGGKLIVVETASRPLYEATNRFYRNNAYEELSRIRDYYSDGDDLIVYGKYLS